MRNGAQNQTKAPLAPTQAFWGQVLGEAELKMRLWWGRRHEKVKPLDQAPGGEAAVGSLPCWA